MKAVKIKMSEKSTSKTLKALITGLLVNFAISLIAIIILTLFIVVAGNLFEKASGYLMLLPLIFGSYFGSFTTARINKSNGLLLGIISAVAVILILLIIGFSTGISDITYMFLLKVLAVFIPSAMGGVKGVNKKERLKI